MSNAYKVKEVLSGQAGHSGTPVTTVTQSAPIDVEELEDPQATITGITTGTVQVQQSPDGVVWSQVGTDLTANGVRQHTGRTKQMRANVTVATSVAVVIKVAGNVAAGYA